MRVTRGKAFLNSSSSKLWRSGLIVLRQIRMFAEQKPANQHAKWILVAEQFLHLFSSRGFPGIGLLLGHEDPASEVKIFTKIARSFFEDRIGAALATLIRSTRVVANAVQTNAQVNSAPMAGFASAGLTCQRPFIAAIVAMTCHEPQLKDSDLD